MKICRFFAILFTLSILLWADWEIRFTTIGQWELAISNFGKFGQNVWGVGGFWPRGTGNNYIYGAGAWTGGVLPNGDTVVSIGYGPHGSESECVPGIPYSNPNDHQWRVYFSTDLNYPFSPISLEDGYAICNDFDATYHMPDSFHIPEPLGITIVLKTYVWPKDWADDVLFIKSIIRNDTTYTINDFYTGICMDFDIGNESTPNSNDRCGVDLPRKLFYGWQEEEESGWDWRGMLGLKLLSSYSLSCFKIYNLNFEPKWDWQRYLTLAGYDYTSGLYEPYDTIWPPPADQRIIMACGPFETFAPGDSIILDWVLIGSRDTLPPFPQQKYCELKYKADKAQAFYDIGMMHDVQVIQPNGGEVISGVYNIIYTANSGTGNPLLIDIYLQSEHGIDTIAFGVNNTGGYDWSTDSVFDCVMARLMILAYDTLTFGGDVSDGYFAIDNPGNAPPLFWLISPQSFDTLSGYVDITWYAFDPEFQDSLFIDIYFKSQYDTAFQIIASDELNDSVYTWNTIPYRNGLGLLVVETYDEEFSAAETVEVYLLNEIPGGDMDHTNGLNNTVGISALLHQPVQITGHTYELAFLEYCALSDGSYYCPEYIYEIRDSNIGVTVLDTYSLKNGYTVFPHFIEINDFSPIIDGFSIRACTENEDIITMANFNNDSVKVVLGSYPEDSIYLYPAMLKIWWAYRGSRLQLDWVHKAGGSLTLLLTDLDYGDTIPYKPYSVSQNCDSAFGWCFRDHFVAGTASDTLRVEDCWLFICGQRIGFSRAVPPPQVGDRWIVYPSEYSPPIKGNVYRFTPTGISENKNQILPISFQVYPVPFTKNLTITYSLPKRQKIKIVIYDVLGRRVRTLKDGTENPGAYKIVWNGADGMNRKASSGVYFCRFTTGESEDYKETKKFILMK